MLDPKRITGLPDETWDEKSKAQYAALKAKALAEMPVEPDWLDQPLVSADDLDNLLDELLADYRARGSGK